MLNQNSKSSSDPNTSFSFDWSPLSLASPLAIASFNVVCLSMMLFNVSRVNDRLARSEEHTYELQSLMRISYAVFCLKKKKKTHPPSQRQITASHSQYPL